jgi:hypothetical protein
MSDTPKTCTYCHGDGSCTMCGGRNCIELLRAELDEVKKDRDDAERAMQAAQVERDQLRGELEDLRARK